MIGPYLIGMVECFDVRVGLGTIRTTEGESIPFHCLSIADGTRDIPTGADVVFRVIRRFGRDEAVGITR